MFTGYIRTKMYFSYICLLVKLYLDDLIELIATAHIQTAGVTFYPLRKHLINDVINEY